MGYATIVGGGEDGRYIIQTDSGESLRARILAAVATNISRLEIRLSTAQTRVNDADAVEAFYVAQFNAAADAYIAQHNAAGQPPNSNALKFARKLMLDARVGHAPLRMALDAVKFDLAQARKLAASMNTVQTTATKAAWCVDFTETGVAGAVVATVDIPGDTSLQLIAPGCRPWALTDGQFMSRDLCSPEQAYFAAAVFPGWQKYLPTYRWGTITGINYVTDTASVALFDQVSTAQRLGVNQSSTLVNVPVDYMDVGASVMRVDDRVVVQFQGQDWDSPKVIGFVDNPRPPGYWDVTWFIVVTDALSPTGRTDTWALLARAGSDYEEPAIYNAAASGSLVAEYRKPPGTTWLPTDRDVSGSGLVEYLMPGESSGFGEALFAIATNLVGGQDIQCYVPRSIGVSVGGILETRLRIGSELVYQSAHAVNPTGRARISLTGRRRNDIAADFPGSLQMDPLDFELAP